MLRHLVAILALATLLLWAGLPAPAAEPQWQIRNQLQPFERDVKAAEGPTTDGLIRIIYDPQSMPLDKGVLTTLLQGRSLVEDAAKDACKKLRLPAPGGEIQAWMIQNVSISGASGQLMVTLQAVTPARDPPHGGPLLSALAERLEAMLRVQQDLSTQELREARDLAEKAVENARREVMARREDQRKLLAAAGQTDPTREGILEAAKTLEAEKQKLELQQCGQAARQKALEKRIAEIAAKAEARVSQDPVAAELENIVKLRARELAMTQQLVDTAKVSAAEALAAEVRVAEARAEWLKRREAAGAMAGREVLAKLNDDLASVSIESVETDARLGCVAKQLDKTRALLPLADEYQDATSSLKSVERSLQQARQRQEIIARQLTGAPAPSVKLLTPAAPPEPEKK
jgi:hypothetical protein